MMIQMMWLLLTCLHVETYTYEKCTSENPSADEDECPAPTGAYPAFPRDTVQE